MIIAGTRPENYSLKSSERRVSSKIASYQKSTNVKQPKSSYAFTFLNYRAPSVMHWSMDHLGNTAKFLLKFFPARAKLFLSIL